MTIFGAYDVRGVYPSELNEDTAYKIGRAFVQQFNLAEVVIGRDGRKSSPALTKSIISGITDQGAKVTDIGICTTPALYFAVGFYNFPGGVMITASHLPKESNGVKFVLEGVMPVDYEHGIEIIEKLVNDSKFKNAEKGIVEKRDITKDYIKFTLDFMKEDIENLKIVVDMSNSPQTPYFDRVAKNFKNCAITKINDSLDGDFPGHEPNPQKPENTVEIREKVKKFNADIGVAFDGDADRVIFIDEKGNQIPGDMITILIALWYENRQLTNEKVLYDVRSSRAVKEVVEKHREEAIPVRTGHSLIKRAMRKEKALFAGEISGHYYFRDNYYSDSAIIASIIVLAMVSRAKKEGKTLSELIKPFQKYFNSGEVNLNVSDKDKKMKEVEKLYKDGRIEHIDGLSVLYDDWWFNLRKSGTEDLLRLMVEAKTKELMEEKRKELVEFIKGR